LVAIKSLKSESQRGAISIAYAMAVVIILFGLASVLLTSVSSDLRGSSNRLIKSRVFFAAESGLELALKELDNSGDGIISGASIDGIIVSTTLVNDTILTATASQAQISRSLRVFVHRSPTLGPFNTFSTGSVSDLWSYDEDGHYAPHLIKHHQRSMPRINYATLVSMAYSQGHRITNPNFTPSNNYPNGSFYYHYGVPNVIHVTGNMNVLSGRTLYGIYVVDGSVTMAANAQVQGVIYLATYNSSISFYGHGYPYWHNIWGGLLVNGCVYAHHCPWISIRYRHVYLQVFRSYMESSSEFSISDWKEL